MCCCSTLRVRSQPQRKAEARAPPPQAFLKAARQAARTGRACSSALIRFATGLTDDDLDAVVDGHSPTSIMLPKAEGGAAVIHCDAKITAREAVHGLARRRALT